MLNASNHVVRYEPSFLVGFLLLLRLHEFYQVFPATSVHLELGLNFL
ncbi:hypothetical protein BVRB_6g129950 [Beta vulgaris subsp. vulgaris]|nr:hypothetical protein BVRB_6g129950 [Beta vulgaris subsp. vulgaris]